MVILDEGKKEGRKQGRKAGRKKRRKEGKRPIKGGRAKKKRLLWDGEKEEETSVYKCLEKLRNLLFTSWVALLRSLCDPHKVIEPS